MTQPLSLSLWKMRLLVHSLSFLLPLVMVLIAVHVSRSWGADDDEEQYITCGEELIQCGNIPNVGYPFWGDNRPPSCGHPGFELTCRDNVLRLSIQSITYRVLDIQPSSRTLIVARDDFWSILCPASLYNASLDSPFSYTSNTQGLTLYFGCSTTSFEPPGMFTCTVNGNTSNNYYSPSNVNLTLGRCTSSLVLRVFQSQIEALARSALTLQAAIAAGFGMQWTATIDAACWPCVQSGGRCGLNTSSVSFACYCPDQPYASTCHNTTPEVPTQVPTQPPTGSSDNKGSVALPIALAAGGAAFAGIGIGWYVFHLRQKKRQQAEQSEQTVQAKSKKAATPPPSNSLETTPWINYSQSIPSYPSLPSRSDLERGSTYFGAHVFSHAELEEATNNFDSSRELGDGGFGRVYYGKLHDGRVVAVKRLYENNFKRVEQFMNEVEILTRLRHKNLVTLYGCTSKRSCELLLVYEFIPNGTVADHIHGKLSNSGLLSWPIRLSIAIETADALAYLHASDVIHRDVKTNNILLDNDFRVKVADFGLSRLFPTDVTHVSTAPQGTPGYVDPEYYQCYQLTEKSDVYSFGVVLIELISSKPAVDTNRHRHDINLANMAVNKIQNHTLHELVDPCLKFETNRHMRRMTTLVAELAFRCLQQERDMRPSMEEVLEALKGIQNEDLNAQKVEVLDIMEDEVGLLKANSPPFSPDSQKWVSSSTTAHSSG